MKYIGKYRNPPKINPADLVTQYALFNALQDQSLIKFLNSNLQALIDHYNVANGIEPAQKIHFGKYLPEAKLIATKINQSSNLIESLLWLVRISEDKNFVARIRDLMDHALSKPELTEDARRGIVSLEWLIANKQYVFAELVKLKPGIALQAANTKLLTTILNKERNGIINALFYAEDGSVEDRVALRGSKP